MPQEESQKSLSLKFLWDCICAPVTPPMPTRTNSSPSPIVTFDDYWPGEYWKRDATPTAIYYKPEVGKANGDLCFSSWGCMACKEFQKDLAAMRNLPKQAATNANVLSSRDMPVVGFYVTPLRHHLSTSDAGPDSEPRHLRLLASDGELHPATSPRGPFQVGLVDAGCAVVCDSSFDLESESTAADEIMHGCLYHHYHMIANACGTSDKQMLAYRSM